MAAINKVRHAIIRKTPEVNYKDNPMKEIDILELFYEEMKEKGVTRDQVFLSIDETALAKLNAKSNEHTGLSDIHRLTDTCIANEWLERTTADPYYKYLSLTENGLQVVLAHAY